MCPEMKQISGLLTSKTTRGRPLAAGDRCGPLVTAADRCGPLVTVPDRW